MVVKFKAIPEAPRRSVRLPPMDVKLLKRLDDDDGWYEEDPEGFRFVVIVVMGGCCTDFVVSQHYS